MKEQSSGNQKSENTIGIQINFSTKTALAVLSLIPMIISTCILIYSSNSREQTQFPTPSEQLK
jgi:hypothetical protein